MTPTVAHHKQRFMYSFATRQVSGSSCMAPAVRHQQSHMTNRSELFLGRTSAVFVTRYLSMIHENDQHEERTHVFRPSLTCLVVTMPCKDIHAHQPKCLGFAGSNTPGDAYRSRCVIYMGCMAIDESRDAWKDMWRMLFLNAYCTRI